jgi:hypothetical protein
MINSVGRAVFSSHERKATVNVGTRSDSNVGNGSTQVKKNVKVGEKSYQIFPWE